MMYRHHNRRKWWIGRSLDGGHRCSPMETGTTVLSKPCASATTTPGTVVIDEANRLPDSTVVQHKSSVGEESAQLMRS